MNPISVGEFESIRREMLGGLVTQHDFDDIDLEVDPYNGDPPSKRKDSELARVLSILDSLEERGSH